MVYSTMLDGIIYGAVWYNICHAKDFGNISERLSLMLRKSFAHHSKDFR